MSKPVAVPAYHEVREADGSTAFYSLDRVLQAPDLQGRCVNKRRLRRACDRLREAGLLYEVPYIGPR